MPSPPLLLAAATPGRPLNLAVLAPVVIIEVALLVCCLTDLARRQRLRGGRGRAASGRPSSACLGPAPSGGMSSLSSACRSTIAARSQPTWRRGKPSSIPRGQANCRELRWGR